MPSTQREDYKRKRGVAISADGEGEEVEPVPTSVQDPWHFGTDPDPHLWPTDTKHWQKLFFLLKKAVKKWK